MKRPLKEEGLDFLIRYNSAVHILRKVKEKEEKSFSDLISGRKPFGLATNFKGNSVPYKSSVHNVKLYQNKDIGYIKQEDTALLNTWRANPSEFGK